MRTNRPWRNIWYVSFVNLSKGILDFMMERIRQEGRGGKALWTASTKERKSPSKKRQTGSASLMNMKGGRTRREGGHKERKDTKGRRTQREGGHKRMNNTEGGRICRVEM